MFFEILASKIVEFYRITIDRLDMTDTKATTCQRQTKCGFGKQEKPTAIKTDFI